MGSDIIIARITTVFNMYDSTKGYHYYSPTFKRPLPPKTTFLIRSDIRSTEIVKKYKIIPLNRGHLSYKARFQMHRVSKIFLNYPSQ